MKFKDMHYSVPAAYILDKLGAFDDEDAQAVRDDADDLAARVRATCVGATTRDPGTLFEHVYAEPHTALDEQHERFDAYLGTFAATELGAGAAR